MADKKWTLAVLILFFVFIVLLIYFALTSAEISTIVQQVQGKERVQKQTHHFVLISQELENPYWKKVEGGAKDAAALYGLKMEYVGPLRSSLEEQMKLLDQAIASRVDGIIVQGMNSDLFTPLINKSVEQGIPVITIDSDAPKSRRATYVGTDNYESGKRLAHRIVEDTGGKGKIGVIIGSNDAENQRLRLEGFKFVTSKFPMMQIIQVLPSNISRIQAELQAEEMLKKHGDITIMVGMSSLDAMGILQAKKNLGMGRIRIYGFDDLDETLRAISQGGIVATIVQKPYMMGYNAVRQLNDLYHGLAVRKENYIGIDIVDKKSGMSGEEK
jgi:ribose transport system substrate-binding protein